MEVIYYIVSGDIVSLVGEVYLDGEVYLIFYLDIGYLKVVVINYFFISFILDDDY